MRWCTQARHSTFLCAPALESCYIGSGYLLTITVIIILAVGLQLGFHEAWLRSCDHQLKGNFQRETATRIHGKHKSCHALLLTKIVTERLYCSFIQATYYDDTRTGVLDGLINFVKGIFSKKEETEEGDDSSPVLVKSLKPTVSIAVLEEKVNHFPWL